VGSTHFLQRDIIKFVALKDITSNHDSQIDETQTIKNAVVAGPITVAAVITVEGNLVVV